MAMAPAHPVPFARPDWLLAVAAGLARSDDDALRRVVAGPERRYERLLCTEAYEVWVIGWPPGTGLEPHDHGGSAGALHVVQGLLAERVLDPVGLATRDRRVIHAGGGVAFGEDHVHEVTNPGPEPAVSVHVYAPRLGTMRYYDVP
jgi:predicted metal-dependent enzyme (double-stranded beta helix superfamily)